MCTHSTNHTQIQPTLHQTCFRLNEILVGEEYQTSTELATNIGVFNHKLSTQTAHAMIPLCPNTDLVTQRQERTLQVNTMIHVQLVQFVQNKHWPTWLKAL